MRFHVDAKFLSLFVLASCHGSARPSEPSPLSSDPSLEVTSQANAERCMTLDLPVLGPATCPTPYQALDQNELMHVCSEPNVTTTFIGSCSLDPNITGTWAPSGVSAKHVSASFDCEGPAPNLPNNWLCSVQTITVSFVDGSSKAFTATEAVELASSNRPLELDHCAPPVLDVSLPSPDGGYAYLLLQIPTTLFVPGQASLQASSQTTSGASVSVSITAPPNRAEFSPGQIVSGEVTFSATSLDPNQRLAFDIEANVASPTTNVEQNLTSVFCGDSNQMYSGQWLVLNEQ